MRVQKVLIDLIKSYPLLKNTVTYYIYVLCPLGFFYHTTDPRSIKESWTKYNGLEGIMTVQSITSGGGSTRKKKEATKMKTRSSK